MSVLLHGGLAQLARALAWHARGRRFDSDILHFHKALDNQGLFLLIEDRKSNFSIDLFHNSIILTKETQGYKAITLYPQVLDKQQSKQWGFNFFFLDEKETKNQVRTIAAAQGTATSRSDKPARSLRI